MNRRNLLMGGVGLMAAAGTGIVAVMAPPEQLPTSDTTVGVPLTTTLTKELVIGLVITLTSTPGEGTDWKDAAAGALVAGKRFSMGGSTVRIITANDKGTRDGARRAVTKLADQGATALVVASSGTHVTDALQVAAERGLAVLLPYQHVGASLPDNAWFTSVTDALIGAGLSQAMTRLGLQRPVLIDAGGGALQTIKPVALLDFAPGSQDKDLVAALKPHLDRKKGTDSLVVTGAAEQLAAAVHAVQGSASNLPVLLTPEALSPAFPTALAKAGGSLMGALTTTGPDIGDSRSSQNNTAGRATSTYLAALRLLASDTKAVAPMGDQPFSTVAAAADVRSHDAVVALVRAAERAQVPTSTRLLAALGELSLGLSDGLAGVELDFTKTSSAMAATAMTTLRSSNEALGLRPRSKATMDLTWFPQPT